MEIIYKDSYEFIEKNCENINIIFSTAKNNLDFNQNNEEGRKNLLRLKEWFGLEDVGYLHQIHSNLIYNYGHQTIEGDGLITDKKNIAIGVFTADCVPVLIYDIDKKIIGVVHSGWRGTFSCIVMNMLERMKQQYGCSNESIYVYIGPHNRSCCYEVGEDLIEKFKKCALYKDTNIYNKNKLDLEACIIRQLEYKKIPKENIISTELCTFCNEQYDFYSYRKQKERSGRMFSFIYMK